MITFENEYFNYYY